MAKGGNLGKASLVLSTKDDTKKGLNKSESGIKFWASGLKGKMGGALAGITASISAAFGTGKLFENLSGLADAGKQAAAIGVASDTFMGLSQAAKEAGVEGEQFGTLLQKAQIKIAEGSPDVQAALSTIGLTLGDLRGKSPDDIFYAVADGLNGVSDQGARALVATKLFEEEGAKLLPVLGRGSAGLKEFVAQQKAMGTALSQEDMNGVLAAQAKVAQLGRRLEGFWNKLTVAAAPFIEITVDAVEAIVAMMPAFEDVKYVALAVFKDIGIAGAYTWDALKAGAGGLVKGISLMVQGVGDLVGSLGEVIQLGAQLPDALGGAQFRGAAVLAGATKLGMTVKSQEMNRWGQQQLDGFGQSAKSVEAWFDALANGKPAQRFGQTAGKQMAQAFSQEYRQNPAIERGSKEDYSARVRFEQQSQTLQQQQAQEVKKTATNTHLMVDLLKALPNKLTGLTGLKFKTV